MKKFILLFLVLIAFINSLNAQGHFTDGPYGGAINCFAINGINIFAGTSNGGVFLSSDKGATWTAMNTGLTSNNISSLSISGINIFAVTESNGVFLSTNNGTSWTAVNTGIPESTSVYSLLISGASIFAGTSNGVYLSNNNGTRWTAVNKGIPISTNVHSLVVSGANIFAGTDNGIYLSNNGGTSWTAVNTGLTSVSTYIYDGSSSKVTSTADIYSLVVSGTNIFAGTHSQGVFKTTNDGLSWTAVNKGLNDSYVSSLVVSGTNIYATILFSGIYESVNNGTSWTAVNTILNNPSFRSLAVYGTNIFAGLVNTIYIFNPIDTTNNLNTKTIQKNNNKIETVKLPPNTGFDIEANEGCFKINKVTGGQVSIIEGYVSKIGVNGPYNLNFGYEPRCCPLTLDCFTKYTVKNYGTGNAVIELEKIEK